MPDEYRYYENYIDNDDDEDYSYEYDMYRPVKPTRKYQPNYDYDDYSDINNNYEKE